MRRYSILFLSSLLTGCLAPSATSPRVGERIVPASEFSRAVHEGRADTFSILDRHDGPKQGPLGQSIASSSAGAGSAAQSGAGDNANSVMEQKLSEARARYQSAAGTAAEGAPVGSAIPTVLENPQAPVIQAQTVSQTTTLKPLELKGDPKFLRDGFQHQGSVDVPSEQIQVPTPSEYGRASVPPPPPPGSSSPYYMGQMTMNPSLWPDESMSTSLFRDLRAFQPMDLVTIVINENSDGQKQSRTNSTTKFSLLAAISNFFGEELEYVSNNAGLDPENLINASTESKFEGNGQARRQGTLKAQMSAVILEVLPNGVLRVEGTKIISVDNEEEVMVISGLVRVRDINATNQVDSNRIANMRIDFYGRGVLGETTSPGWGARLVRAVWPF